MICFWIRDLLRCLLRPKCDGCQCAGVTAYVHKTAKDKQPQTQTKIILITSAVLMLHRRDRSVACEHEFKTISVSSQNNKRFLLRTSNISKTLVFQHFPRVEALRSRLDQKSVFQMAFFSVTRAPLRVMRYPPSAAYTKCVIDRTEKACPSHPEARHLLAFGAANGKHILLR